MVRGLIGGSPDIDAAGWDDVDWVGLTEIQELHSGLHSSMSGQGGLGHGHARHGRSIGTVLGGDARGQEGRQKLRLVTVPWKDGPTPVAADPGALLTRPEPP